MIKWENNTFGKAGKFYPFLYLSPLPIIGISLFLLGYSLASGFQLWERLVVAGFGIFFLIYVVKAIEAIVITRSTIQEISSDGSVFSVKTFSGKHFKVDQFSQIMEDEKFFAKKNIQFLFPANVKNMIVRCDSGDYYISGNIEGIATLRELIKKEPKKEPRRTGTPKENPNPN